MLRLIGYLVSLLVAVFSKLDSDQIKEWVDKYILDPIENKIIATENQVDDELLGIIKKIREVFEIEDND